jgi:hypothetical protein
MEYTEPKITNVLKADSVIQSLMKGQPFPETAIDVTTNNPGVESDE